MKKIISTLIAAGALMHSALGSEWLTDVSAAKEKAAKENKAIMMDFTGSDWCGYCIKLKKAVFDTPEFEKFAAEKLVLVEVDFPSKKKQPAELKKANEKLRDQYKIEGYPTLQFIDAKGKVLGQIVGYEGEKPKEWIQKAEQIVNKK